VIRLFALDHPEMPGAQLAVIDGCGHLPNLEKPAEFNQAVTAFLDRRPSRR